MFHILHLAWVISYCGTCLAWCSLSPPKEVKMWSWEIKLFLIIIVCWFTNLVSRSDLSTELQTPVFYWLLKSSPLLHVQSGAWFFTFSLKAHIAKFPYSVNATPSSQSFWPKPYSHPWLLSFTQTLHIFLKQNLFIPPSDLYRICAHHSSPTAISVIQTVTLYLLDYWNSLSWSSCFCPFPQVLVSTQL